jgi:general secretion pathway protein E
MSVVEVFPGAATKPSAQGSGEMPDCVDALGCLVVLAQGSILERHAITRTKMFIGRGPHADVRLESPFVSVYHAMLVYETSALFVVDLHSKNRTVVNGRRVKRHALAHGDLITLGDSMMRYEAPPRASAGGSESDVTTGSTAVAIGALADHREGVVAEQAAAPPPTEHSSGSTLVLEHPTFESCDAELAAPEVGVNIVAMTGRDHFVEPAGGPDAARADGAPPSAIAEAKPAVDEAVVAAAVADAARQGCPVLDVLETATGLDGSALMVELARLLRYSSIEARELMTLEADFERLPPAEARRRGCVVVRRGPDLTAVLCDPFDADLRPWLEARVAVPLRWALVGRGDLNAFISRHEQNLRAIDSALQGAHGEVGKAGDIEELSLASINRESSAVVKLVRSTLFDALRANASDIHLEAGLNRLEIRYRIDGVLVQVASVPGADIAEQVISRVKVMSELDIAERRVPQDGRFKSSFNDRSIDFRVSIMPSTYGEDAVLRVLDKQAITDQMSELRLDGLGFETRVVEALRRLSALPHGMLLVTGPTGSGKTTTLYAAISETNTGIGKIVTIEDPVEYQLRGVLQIPVNEKKGLTFARGLRSILRHDPDTIMVGEIRDPETAQIAVQSALTGHLVFTTVHANNVFDVLSRFTHMGVDVYSFTAALNGILAQRLLRMVCESCAEPITPTLQMLDATGLPAEAAREFRWHGGRGCSQCRGTGYRGRRAIGELLVLNDELREAIVARVPVRQLKELAHKNHVRLIRAVALDLVRRGMTTIEEANRVTAVS